MKKHILFKPIVLLFLLFPLSAFCEDVILDHVLQTTSPVQYEKTEFEIKLSSAFINPYDAAEIMLNMKVAAPSGKTIIVPCYFESGNSTSSTWKARFAAREAGTYSYHFQLQKGENVVENSEIKTFTVSASAKNGFITTKDSWSFKFDSGKPFRGIGENVAWESRSFDDPKWTYDYLLKKLSDNGANYFRTWMSPWNLPLEWKTVSQTNRYSNSDNYFNPGAIQRMDELVELSESLGMYMMLTLDYHGALREGDYWGTNNYNVANGGPASTPTEFFTLQAAKDKYKNKLRYLVARWGYSTSINSWEFFNEIDNAAYGPDGNITIPHDAITAWHDEMSTYLKSIDPYDHIVTTSISHRDISGLNQVPNIDFNQRHVYRYTGTLPATIRDYIASTGKPYVIGEFGYEWDWNINFETIAKEKDIDYKRGLWYGLFSPTPIMPLSWWWEFFDERGMTSYFRGVKLISDKMLQAGNGDFIEASVNAPGYDAYAVKTGEKYFIYLINYSTSSKLTDVALTVSANIPYAIKRFNPDDLSYNNNKIISALGGLITIPQVALQPYEELIFEIAPEDYKENERSPYTGSLIELPGDVEVENFDSGGQGVAYNDLDNVNVPGKYRTGEGVDIAEKTTGGFYITDIVNGEWLEFSVNVATTGTYMLTANVSATEAGKTFSVLMDGENISGVIEVPATGGDQLFQEVSKFTSSITAGNKIMRIMMDASGFNIDNVTLTLLNKAPNVTLLTPEAEDTFTAPVTIALSAEANDEDGNIAKVQFLNGDSLIAEVTEQPYTFQWEAPHGNHKISAKAFDDEGLSNTSNSVNVLVHPSTQQDPFEGTPFRIPGLIQAENYDMGANGVAYSDKSPGNKFNVYRNDDVDVETSTDEGGGFNLGDTQVGEWVEYTINVQEEGFYDLESRVATNMGGTSFHLEIDGQNISGKIDVPNTGGWQTWSTIKTEKIYLKAGEQVLRLVIGGEYFNLNHLSFSPSVTDDLIHEAEAGTLTGTEIGTSREGFTGSGYVTGFSENSDKVSVNIDVEEAGVYILKIRYASEYEDKINDVYVNGMLLKNHNFKKTAQFLTADLGYVNLNQGNNLIEIRSSWGWIDVDHFRFTPLPKGFIILEAEEGELSGTAVANWRAGFTGTGYVTDFTESADKLTINVAVEEERTYTLNIRYLSEYDNKVNDVYVNGVLLKNQVFPQIATFSTIEIGDVTLNAGSNSIEIRTNNGWFEVDHLTLTPRPKGYSIVEAEEGILSGTAIATSKPGFTGTGYVTDFTESADKVSIEVDSETAVRYMLEIRYASEYDNKKNDIYINGTFLVKQVFPQTTVFKTVEVGEIDLLPGTNTIEIQTDNGWFDVDHFALYPVEGYNYTPVVLAAIPEIKHVLTKGTTKFKQYVALSKVFSDIEDGADLVFKIESNTNPSLVKVFFKDGFIDVELLKNTTGNATINISATDKKGASVSTSFDVQVKEGNGNLALFKPTFSSTNENNTNIAEKATDGSAESRWSSEYSDPQWIYVDLGASINFDKVKLIWEGAYGIAYEIQVSADAQNWNTVFSESSGDGSEDVITFSKVNARYVRMYGTSRATPYGFSLYEFEVYNTKADVVTSNLEVVKDFDVLVYPNPANDHLSISFPVEGQYKLYIYDAIGKQKTTRQFSSNKVNIDVSSWKKGVYIFVLETKRKTFNKRVILE